MHMDLSVFADASQSNRATLDNWLSQWRLLLCTDGNGWLEYLESAAESSAASPETADSPPSDAITVANVLAFLSNLSSAVVHFDVQVAVDPSHHGASSSYQNTLPPEWTVAIDPHQCHSPVLLGRLVDNVLQWFERCTGLDKSITSSLDTFGLQRLSRISQQHTLYHASTLNRLASIGASAWCRKLHAVRPDELMYLCQWNQRVGKIIRQCWDTATLVVHSLRVLGHDRYESLKTAFAALQQALTAEPERPVTTSRSWHESCAAILEHLTAITHICQASPRAGWKQVAEHLELFTLLVQLYYYYSQLAASRQPQTSTGASRNSVPTNVTQRCIQGAWLTSSVIYLILVLAGFPMAECQRAWDDLWSASPTRILDVDALRDDMAPMFVTATPSSSKTPFTHTVSSSSVHSDRLAQLGQYCMVIIEKSQVQPISAQGTQASLWVMLDRRFSILASLQAIQSQEPDNEPLAYAIMFITNQTDRSTAESAVTKKMANLSVQATTPRLSADLTQAVELAQCMDPIEYTAAISNIQEIFSDLGSGYILALLALKGYNGEQVIMDLLEEQVPDAVQALDTALAVEDLFALLQPPSPIQEEEEENGEDPLANRLNVFDRDEFDVFHHGTVADSSRVYRKVDAAGWPMSVPGSHGKQMPGGTEWLTAQNEADDYKQRILEQAEADWDDEYDDTYDDALLAIPGASGDEDGEREDTADNNGVDKGIAGPSRRPDASQTNSSAPLPASDPTAPFETMLLAEAVANPETFARNKTARQSKQRQALLAKTKLSNEQLEGWYSMLNRDPRGKHKLEAQKLSRDTNRPAHQPLRGPKPPSSTAARGGINNAGWLLQAIVSVDYL
ncbi:hypothetical protein H4R34_004698 [Dimargaris verticillata]|uniref:CUE domain-containing protein n=1 Tax=Dimargaris verticillata TaxID=2761393 RepID=A0A9W8AZN4_9FUNG|nr:hypothetical protein H4R34_004698 [Dimargaris verticillata]